MHGKLQLIEGINEALNVLEEQVISESRLFERSSKHNQQPHAQQH
jgi:hypothetical protein